MNSQLDVRCGLEVHSQLNFLQTKLFCTCSTYLTGKRANENTCPICLGLPGSLPELNGTAVLFGIKLAKALSMEITSTLEFSRKHYDYPDLPKGYQITQADSGIIGVNGFLPVNDKNIPIRSIQLEEDPAKIIYQKDQTIIDFNRSGTTLIELVTDPIFKTSEDIRLFLNQYRRLLLHLGISDTKKEGAFRADVNVSVGDHPRVEVKNVGSDTEIINAFEYEIKRQSEISDYKNIAMETRHWDSLSGTSIVSREKEELHDYQYMPEGNIPKVDLTTVNVKPIEDTSLPWKVEKALSLEYNLTTSQLNTLLDHPNLIDIYRSLFSFSEIREDIKERFFWQEYMSWLNRIETISNTEIINRIHSIDINSIRKLLKLVSEEKLPLKEFKRILRRHIEKNDPLNISEKKSMTMEQLISELRDKFPLIIKESKTNKNKINFLVGQAMKLSKGTFQPKVLRKRIELEVEKM